MPELIAMSRKIDIILLSETWLNANTPFSIPDFHVVRRDRLNKKGGGVAICIRQKILSSLLYHLSSIVRVKLN